MSVAPKKMEARNLRSVSRDMSRTPPTIATKQTFLKRTSPSLPLTKKPAKKQNEKVEKKESKGKNSEELKKENKLKRKNLSKVQEETETIKMKEVAVDLTILDPTLIAGTSKEVESPSSQPLFQTASDSESDNPDLKLEEAHDSIVLSEEEEEKNEETVKNGTPTSQSKRSRRGTSKSSDRQSVDSNYEFLVIENPTKESTPVRRKKAANTSNNTEETPGRRRLNRDSSAASDILEKPEVAEARRKLEELIKEPREEYGIQKRSMQVIKAVRAKNLMATAIAATTRLPVSVMHLVTDALSVMEEQILELECRRQHAEAKMEGMLLMQKIRKEQEIDESMYIEVESTPKDTTQKKKNGNNEEDQKKNKGKYEERRTKERQEEAKSGKAEEVKRTEESENPAKGEDTKITPKLLYNQAARKATASILIRDKGSREGPEVMKQIEDGCLVDMATIAETKTIRKGILIEFKTAEQAMLAKSRLEENEIVKKTLKLDRAEMRRKKIMFMHIPKDTSSDEITDKVIEILKISGRKAIHEDILFGKKITRGRTFHLAVTLPEPLANYLLQKKEIRLFNKICPIKNYVVILRCSNCQELDHVKEDCNWQQKCAICGGNHGSKVCRRQYARCYSCKTFNDCNRSDRSRPVNVEHKAYTPGCHVYSTLLRIRQLELESGIKKLTQGVSVIRGDVEQHT